jgi:hypothetical protein
VAASAAAYALLFLLGVAVGVIGSFQYSREIGPVPVLALVFDAVVFAGCRLAGVGMGTPLGGLAVALGWLLSSLVLTLPTAAGSVIITNTAAGKWYLYGGSVCAALGVVFGVRARSGRGPRPRPGGGPPRWPAGGGPSAGVSL